MEKKNSERRIYGRTRLWELLNQSFLEEVCRKYKYKMEDLNALRKVAADLKICIKDQECFYCLLSEESLEKERQMSALILLTLGSGPDLLQERYCKSDRLLEAYMIENITGELLLRGYDKVHRLIGEQTGWYVTQMYFFGSTDKLPLTEMPEALKKLEAKKVVCTPDFCLRPSKSVLYQAELSDSAAEIVCTSPCQTCGRRGNCENAGVFVDAISEKKTKFPPVKK